MQVWRVMMRVTGKEDGCDELGRITEKQNFLGRSELNSYWRRWDNNWGDVNCGQCPVNFSGPVCYFWPRRIE